MGIGDTVVAAPAPSAPVGPFPQQNAAAGGIPPSAHVWNPPTSTAEARNGVPGVAVLLLTGRGFRLHCTFPVHVSRGVKGSATTPSWLKLSSPQQSASPLATTPQLAPVPAETERKAFPPKTGTGVSWLPSETSPFP